jgi:hypothetical protein
VQNPGTLSGKLTSPTSKPQNPNPESRTQNPKPKT